MATDFKNKNSVETSLNEIGTVSNGMRELTRAELEIMQILWRKGAAFVGEILDEMPAPKPAYNTVSTVVRVLEKKGVVDYKAFGKSHQYYPLIKKEEYTHTYIRNVVGAFFDNSLSQMVSFFCERENLSVSETQELLDVAKSVIENRKNSAKK